MNILLFIVCNMAQGFQHAKVDGECLWIGRNSFNPIKICQNIDIKLVNDNVFPKCYVLPFFHEAQKKVLSANRKFDELSFNSINISPISHYSSPEPKGIEYDVKNISDYKNNKRSNILEAHNPNSSQCTSEHLYNFDVSFKTIDNIVNEFKYGFHVLLICIIAFVASRAARLK